MSVTYVTGVGCGLPLCLKSLPIVVACTLGQYRRFKSQLLAGLALPMRNGSYYGDAIELFALARFGAH